MAGLKRSFVGCVPGLFSEVGLRGVVTASPATGFGDPRLLMQRQARLVVEPIGGLGGYRYPPNNQRAEDLRSTSPRERGKLLDLRLYYVKRLDFGD